MCIYMYNYCDTHLHIQYMYTCTCIVICNSYIIIIRYLQTPVAFIHVHVHIQFTSHHPTTHKSSVLVPSSGKVIFTFGWSFWGGGTCYTVAYWVIPNTLLWDNTGDIMVSLIANHCCHHSLYTVYKDYQNQLREYYTRILVLKPSLLLYTRSLRQILSHPKDPIPMSHKYEVVYRIPCKDCDKSYVGQTLKTLDSPCHLS